MKKIVIIIVALLVFFLLILFMRRSPVTPLPSSQAVAEEDDRLWVTATPSEKSETATMTVKVFFLNRKQDPNVLDCERMYPVMRRVPKTSAVARAALEQLLLGPTAQESGDGYFTNSNSGVRIQKLSIVRGIARVDFDERLRENVGGSCRVLAIRAQITETLKQFPTVKEVIISVNGQTENILEP